MGPDRLIEGKVSSREILDSWKDVADYLKRDVRTCQRWERTMGLPVHRLDGSPRARVFVYKDELDEWIAAKAHEHVASEITSRKTAAVIGVIILFIGAVSYGLWRWVFNPRPSGPGSIAVLPFTDLSPSKDQAPWCEGIAETILNALADARGLRILSRNSSFLFTSEGDLLKAGRMLDAGRLLTGSLQRSENRIRIIVRLVDAKSGDQLWSKLYDREAADVFAVQDEIAKDVFEALNAEVPSPAHTFLARTGTKDLGAYNLYIQGRYFWNKRGKDDLLKSIDFFLKAVALDPGYAPAYAGLADAYWILGNNLLLPSDQAYPKARQFARKAIELDDTLAAVHATLACIHAEYDRDFAAAETEIRKAVAMNKTDAHVHHLHSFLLSYQGRTEDAVEEAERARDLDPLAPRTRANVGFQLYLAGKYREALDALNDVLAFDPTHCAVRYYLSVVHLELGEFQKALAAIRTYQQCQGSPTSLAFLALIQARGGDEEGAREVLRELTERPGAGYLSPARLAAVYGALGESDAAFDLLEKAYAERDNKLVQLKVNPIYAPLRSDPRFEGLLRKIGLDSERYFLKK